MTSTAADQLPSWNDGPAKQGILAFIAKVIKEGSPDFLPLDEPLRIGLILLSTATGAPFLPKLAQVAQGDSAFSVGLMVLLMVVTIIFTPVVLPLLLSGVAVNPWDIAQSLILLMLIPLAIGLLLNAHYEEMAARLQPVFS